MIRKAVLTDIDAVSRIYEHIHDLEEAGRIWVGWKRGVYPTRKTAEVALECGDLFVYEQDGEILAAARINREQAPEYALCGWQYPAPDDKVMVLHTLVVEPAAAQRGLGSAFVRFYEQYARSAGCVCARLDTGPGNAAARRLYRRLGYREVGILPCNFQGIPGARLVCLEKRLL